MKGAFVVVLSLLGIIVLSELQNTLGSSIERLPLNITEAKRATLIEIANNKARALGYKLEELNFELSKESRSYKAYFYPKQTKGSVTYGVALTIYLDQKGKILRFDRGI